MIDAIRFTYAPSVRTITHFLTLARTRRFNACVASRTLARVPSLTVDEKADARAFAEALFSVDGAAPDSARMDWFEEDLSDFAAHLTPRARRLFGACLAMPTWLAPPLVGKVGRLRTLSIAERIEALEKLERSPIGIALFATKAMTSLVYHEHPDAAREIGWDRACKGGGR